MLSFVNKTLNLLVKENIDYILKKKFYCFKINKNLKFNTFLSNQKDYINNLHKYPLYDKEFMILFKNLKNHLNFQFIIFLLKLIIN